MDLFQHRQGLGASLEQHNAFHNIIAIVDSDFAQTHARADAGLAEVSHEDRRAFFLRHDGVGNVLEFLDQPHATDIETLLPHREVVAAHIGIALGEAIHDLVERDVVTHELAGI